MEKYNNELDFRRIIREIKRLWWLYVVALVVLMGGGIFYYIRSMPQYTATGNLLIEDSSENTPSAGSGGVSAIMRSFSIGGFGSSSVDNELMVMGSNTLRRRVIDKLKMNRTYIERDGIKKRMLYDDSPVCVEASKEFFDTLTSAMTIRIKLDKGRVNVKVTQGRIFKKIIGELNNAPLPCTLSTSYGDFQLLKANDYTPETKADIDVIVTGNEAAAKVLSEKLYMEISDAKTDVISLTYRSPNRKLAMDVVNMAMEEYNKIRIERRHSNAAKEIEYFRSRLEVISSSLADSEINLEKFKKDHKLMGVEQEAGLLVGTTVGKKEELVKLQAQIDYYKEILKALKDGNDGDLLPVLDSSKIASIGAYNDAIMKRKNLEMSATSENKALQLLNSQIDYMRQLIKGNVEMLLEQGELNMATLKQLTGTAVNRISELPELEREYIALLRDQKFQNELYLFLLQKKESAELKFYSNSTLGFVFERAYSELKPKNSKGTVVLIGAILLSMILPSIAAFIWLTYRNRVESPIDMHFIGLESSSIFYSGKKSQLCDIRKKLIESPEKKVVYVASIDTEAKSILNELIDSFRNIGLNPVVEAPIKDNDILLSKAFKLRLSDLCSQHDAVFVNIPEPSQLSQISSLINTPSSWLLLLIESGKIGRNKLKGLLYGLEKSNIATIIFK